MKTKLLFTSPLLASIISFFKPKSLLFITLLLSNFVGFSQNTNIPDTEFERTLINLGYDSGTIDGVVRTANISGITSLNLSSRGITDLTGIGAFINLTSLKCNSNLLTILDVSANTNLTFLKCKNNRLMSLDVSTNTALTSLNCKNNQLTNLNIKNGNNSNFTLFKAENNPNLICIEADSAYRDSTSIWISGVDTTASFNENCTTTTQSSSTSPTTRAKSKQNTVISSHNRNGEPKSSDIYISPNPTKDIIYINNVSENTNYILLNIKGQIRKKGILSTVNNSINILSLPNSIYFLKLKTSKGSFIRKVVKN